MMGTQEHDITAQHALPRSLRRRARLATLTQVAGFSLLSLLVATSAALTKDIHTRSRAADQHLQPLAAIHIQHINTPATQPTPETHLSTPPAEPASVEPVSLETTAEPATSTAQPEPAEPAEQWSPDTRWFNGRPVRPARTIRMLVTAYSPDHRSCAPFDDGLTASLHSVWTNNMRLVAADSRVLPLGSIITVPGYANEQIVPVLDRGGAIKGNRLDVLYPTHNRALRWGKKWLDITVWEYADGLPKPDIRAIRDSRN